MIYHFLSYLHQMQDILHWAHKLACDGLFLWRCCNNFTFMKQLLQELKKQREKKGLSQDYIADLIGVSHSTISRWECGEVDITLQQIMHYAETIGINIKEVFAFLAQEEDLPRPIASVHVEVFSHEAFSTLTEIVCKLGL